MKEVDNNQVFKFQWSLLGDISTGRANLGGSMPITVYRLFEFCMREALANRFGEAVSIEIFRDAGRVAGTHFYEKYLTECKTMSELLADLKNVFLELKMGVVRIEELEEDGKLTLAISEDIDCSGLPVVGDTVCHYDEGFLEGVLSRFSNKSYEAIEIDCWAKGDRVCRFEAKPKDVILSD